MKDLETLQAEFAVAYYRFAVQEWEAELAHDCSRLRRFRSPFSSSVVSRLAVAEPSARSDLVAVWLQRGHPLATKILGIELTPRQAELSGHRTEWPVLNAADDPATAPLSPPVSKRAVAKEARAKLAFLGHVEPMGSRLTWRYRTPHGPFSILTYVDVGGRMWDLSYQQDIVLGDMRIERFVSFLAWLGVGASKWVLYTQDDVTQAVDLLGELASHFLESLPRLLPQG